MVRQNVLFWDKCENLSHVRGVFSIYIVVLELVL